MDILEKLMNFGLTRQEAVIYSLLFSEGKLNGYEASKLSGISKSNTYSTLASLVDKGAAYMLQENAISYMPVDIEEFCNNKIRFLNELKKELILDIPKKRQKMDGYITIRGKKNILDKLENMLLSAKERVYIFMSLNRINELKDILKELIKQNIKVVIITDKAFILDGAKLYLKECDESQIRIIIDSIYVLTGEIENEQSSTCLYSSNSNLVDVFKQALANEIKLIEIDREDTK